MQSVAWIGMSITGIVGYHCTIKFDGVTSNFGSLLGITLFQMYFRGTIRNNIGIPQTT